MYDMRPDRSNNGVNFWICKDFFNKVTDMEDAHTHLLSLPGDKDTCYFGVFDGHGGLNLFY